MLKEIDYAVITVFMGSVFLDINIGNAEETAQAESDYGALLGHFQSQKHQLGLGQLDNLGQLNEEARELLSDSFRRTGFAKDLVWEPLRPLYAGRIVIQLCTEAPKAVENFRCLATGERGVGKSSGKPLHYKGCRFHRIVKGFMVQGGDIVKGDGSAGDSIYGGTFKDEAAGLKLKHDTAGVVSMANSGKHSNRSQFFITLAATPQCDRKHVVIGNVTSGLDILQRIDEEAASSTGAPCTGVYIADCGEIS